MLAVRSLDREHELRHLARVRPVPGLCNKLVCHIIGVGPEGDVFGSDEYHALCPRVEFVPGPGRDGPDRCLRGCRSVLAGVDHAYVGRFVGDNNLLTARVVDPGEDGTATAETPVGTVTARAGNELDAETEGVMLVRPEDIALGADANDVANQFTARPRDRTYTGEMTEFVFAVEGTDGEHEVQVIYPGNVRTEAFRTAEGVPLGWETADAVCFSRLSASGGTSVEDLQRF